MAVENWDETALITIKASGSHSNAFNIAAITETIDIDLGDKDGEGIASLSGGRLWKKIPEADTTITFEGYPVGIGDMDSSTPDGLMADFFYGTVATQPLTVSNTLLTRNVYTVYILWTNASATWATESVATPSAALRYKFSNAYLVSCKPSFTDGILKATWKFKLAPRNKAGTANITVESTDGTASLTTL